MKKCVVLLSSGLDSTVNLKWALQEYKVLLALTFNYGQRAAKSEVRQSQKICKSWDVKHQVLDLPFFTSWGKSSLIDRNLNIPSGKDISIDDLVVSQNTAKSVWVPNRNGIFLNIAAGFAESLSADFIVPGFNLEEASTFPDNSNDFLQQTTKALSFSTANQVQAVSLTVGLNKTQIVKKGIELGVDFNLIWPCYNNGEFWCKSCESCQRSMRALAVNNIKVN